VFFSWVNGWFSILVALSGKSIGCEKFRWVGSIEIGSRIPFSVLCSSRPEKAGKQRENRQQAGAGRRVVEGGKSGTQTPPQAHRGLLPERRAGYGRDAWAKIVVNKHTPPPGAAKKIVSNISLGAASGGREPMQPAAGKGLRNAAPPYFAPPGAEIRVAAIYPEIRS
jgi:hypothetical protein